MVGENVQIIAGNPISIVDLRSRRIPNVLSLDRLGMGEAKYSALIGDALGPFDSGYRSVRRCTFDIIR